MSAWTLPDQYVQVGEIRTRFWAAGNEGTTIVLIHGLGRYVEDWMYNVRALAEQHRVYAIDLVGSGRSDKPLAPYSLLYLAQFVNHFMKTQSIGQASLIGHSLGGSVALQYAIRFPNEVEKLVLVNSAGLGKEVPLSLRLSSLPVMGKWLTHPSQKGIFNSLKKRVYDPALLTDEWVELCYRHAILPDAQRALLSTVSALIDLGGMRNDVVRPILDNLACIAVPTLVVWGRQDPILPVTHAYIAEKRMPYAQLHIFDPCRHFTQMERSKEFNALVLKFLASATA